VMTTLDAVPKKKPDPSEDEAAAKELVWLAREQGLALTGPDGLLKQFTRSVLETALNEEMTEHLVMRSTGHRAAGLDQCPQRDPAQDGADRGHRAGRDRRAAGSRRVVSAADREEMTNLILPPSDRGR